MNKKNLVFGIASILFAAILIFSGCQQPVENGGETIREGDGTFELDSPLLIEVWDSSSPRKFLGYDTGLRDYSQSQPIILTSEGYCVLLNDLFYSTTTTKIKNHYGPFGADDDGYITNNTDWGDVLFFTTASNPTANAVPYLLSTWTSNIINYVYYNPHDGGTYYTWTGGTGEIKTMPSGFKLYDAAGRLRSCNDNDIAGVLRGMEWSDLVGETLNLRPLKKIGGYSAMGLPNPNEVTAPFVYKVKN